MGLSTQVNLEPGRRPAIVVVKNEGSPPANNGVLDAVVHWWRLAGSSVEPDQWPAEEDLPHVGTNQSSRSSVCIRS